jgi:hypothetical protein
MVAPVLLHLPNALPFSYWLAAGVNATETLDDLHGLCVPLFERNIGVRV